MHSATYNCHGLSAYVVLSAIVLTSNSSFCARWAKLPSSAVSGSGSSLPNAIGVRETPPVGALSLGMLADRSVTRLHWHNPPYVLVWSAGARVRQTRSDEARDDRVTAPMQQSVPGARSEQDNKSTAHTAYQQLDALRSGIGSECEIRSWLCQFEINFCCAFLR